MNSSTTVAQPFFYCKYYNTKQLFRKEDAAPHTLQEELVPAAKSAMNKHTLKKAYNINEIPNSFSARPLEGKDLHIFYEDTIQVRTADKYTSPIQDIFDACIYPSEDHIFILMGHTGCGKSTELNKMADEMKSQGFMVRTVNCLADLGQTPMYTDLLILMGEALISIADEIDCSLDSDLGKAVLEFWNTEITKITDSSDEYTIDLNAGADLDTSTVFFKIFKLFAGIKTGIKLKQMDSTEYKRKIEQRSEEWYAYIAKIADLITEKLEGRQPVIIFEDLDKLDRGNPEIVWDMFSVHADNLSNFSFPVIYTFPISMSYDPRFGTLTGYFINKTLPMIELQYADNTPCEEGFQKIKNIVWSRADSSLFEEDAVNLMIEKTGGSLRDLFSAIRDASTRARRRKAAVINIEDASIALDNLESDLTRRIEVKDYPFLISIINGNRRNIENREKLLEMLTANVVMEYNRERWHNVHPLIKDFLQKTGQLTSDVPAEESSAHE